jgi:hypothetical protein
MPVQDVDIRRNKTLARIGPRIAKGRLNTALFSKQLIG